ncbi:MAG: amino acid racemase [Gemmatimonadales bacterium]|nr:amino acid racemase [Gemmatimonadales bacterium]
MTHRSHPTVGVLGGLGPDATLDFFARLLRDTPAANDQDHLHLLIDNNPQVPDRNAAVAGTGPSPAPMLAEMARRLERAGADFLVMPCNAAHAFQDAIEEAVSIPFVSIITETRDEVMRRFPKLRCAGVMASTGCLDAQLYQRAFGEEQVAVVVPEGPDRDTFMQVLYEIKSGDRSAHAKATIQAVAAGLVDRGAEIIVAGCTEVPLVLDDSDIPCPSVSSTDVLVTQTIAKVREWAEGRSGTR